MSNEKRYLREREKNTITERKGEIAEIDAKSKGQNYL